MHTSSFLGNVRDRFDLRSLRNVAEGFQDIYGLELLGGVIRSNPSSKFRFLFPQQIEHVTMPSKSTSNYPDLYPPSPKRLSQESYNEALRNSTGNNNGQSLPTNYPDLIRTANIFPQNSLYPGSGIYKEYRTSAEECVLTEDLQDFYIQLIKFTSHTSYCDRTKETRVPLEDLNQTINNSRTPEWGSFGKTQQSSSHQSSTPSTSQSSTDSLWTALEFTADIFRAYYSYTNNNNINITINTNNTNNNDNTQNNNKNTPPKKKKEEPPTTTLAPLNQTPFTPEIEIQILRKNIQSLREQLRPLERNSNNNNNTNKKDNSSDNEKRMDALRRELAVQEQMLEEVEMREENKRMSMTRLVIGGLRYVLK